MYESLTDNKFPHHPAMTNHGSTRQCLIVLGMHRSGTSALAGALNAAGVKLGAELLGPAEDNPKGYYECKAIQQFHDQKLLPILGRDWKTPHPLLDTGWVDRPDVEALVEEAKGIIECEFSSEPLFAIKDPRLCILYPFWVKVLGALNISIKVIFAYRKPLEVAGSLSKRNGFSTRQGLALWATHMLSAELFSREHPRAFVDYDQLLRDASSTLDRIASNLSLSWPASPEEIAIRLGGHIDPGLRHNTQPSQETIQAPFAAIDALFDFIPAGQPTPAAHFDETFRIYRESLDTFSEVLQLSRLAEVEVFYDTGSGYSERRKVKAFFDPAAPTSHLRFKLPAQEKIQRLRFDPANTTCSLVLKDIRLDTPTAPINLIENVRSNALYRRDSFFIFRGTDPNIHIELPQPTPFDRLGIAIEAVVLGEQASCVADVIDALKEEQGSHKARINELKERLAETKAAHDEAQGLAKSRIATLNRDLGQSRRHNDALSNELACAQQMLHEANQDRNQLITGLAAASERGAALQRVAESLQQELLAMHASRSWRLTRPLRALMRRLGR